MTRLATAAVLLAACLAALFLLPNAGWAALLLVVVLLGAWEWCALGGLVGASRWAFCAVVFVSVAGLYLWPAGGPVAGSDADRVVYAASCLFWALVVPAWFAGRRERLAPLAAALAGWLVLVPTWLAITRLQADPLNLLHLMGIVWLADTGAYLAGRKWGRRKLAPQISPGKTWEGVAGAAVVVAVYYVILSGSSTARPWAAGWSGWLVVAGIVAAGIAGDLFESWMKRRAGVKDSGTLLPGHGGILDRIDGLTAAMPLAALASGYLA